MGKTPSFDELVGLLATMWFGQMLGPALGTLFLICFGWLAGAIVGVIRMESGSRFSTLQFLVVSFVITVGAAGTLAGMITTHWQGAGPASQWLFLVAVMIPAVGTSWIGIFKWAAGLARGIMERIATQRFKASGDE